MTWKVDLKATEDQVHDLFVAEDKCRSGTKVVKVDREALKNLLIDYNVMRGALERSGRITNGASSSE